MDVGSTAVEATLNLNLFKEKNTHGRVVKLAVIQGQIDELTQSCF